MRRRTWARWIGSLFLFGSVLGGVLARAEAGPEVLPDQAKLDEADRLYREGVDAFMRDDVPKAYEKLKAAYALKKSFDILGNLADIERRLGKARDSAEHYAASLRVFPPNGKPESRSRSEKRLAEVRKQVGTVQVTVSDPDATVLVDGVEVGSSPIVEEIFVEPGKRTFEARKDGRVVKVERACAVGLTIQIELRLDPVGSSGSGAPVGSSTALGASSSAPTASATQAPIEPAPKKALWPVAVGASLVGVGIGVGVGLTVAAGSKTSAAETAASQVRSCTGKETSGTCAEGSRAAGSANTLRGGSIAAFGISGGLAVATLIYLAVPPSRAKSTASVTVVPVVGPDAQGLILHGSF